MTHAQPHVWPNRSRRTQRLLWHPLLRRRQPKKPHSAKPSTSSAARTIEAEQDRKAEERRLEQEREDAEYEARQAEREQLRNQREATFERLIADAPEAFTAPQLRVLLRALVNLDPYTFTDDLAEEIADENEKRSTEEVLLSVIDGTADGKLTAFALRLALSGHRGIPREGEPDFLTEAEAVFAPQQKKAKTQKAKNAPVAISSPKAQPKKKTAKKQIAA